MELKECIEVVEKMLSNQPKNNSTPYTQVVYERGYLTGLLAQMMMEDPRIRHEIISRANKLKKPIEVTK
jgi:hypothetical protein